MKIVICAASKTGTKEALRLRLWDDLDDVIDRLDKLCEDGQMAASVGRVVIEEQNVAYEVVGALASPNPATLRDFGRGFDMMIHQNKGKRLRGKKYGKYATAIADGRKEVLRPAVDRLDIIHRDTGILVAVLTRSGEGASAEPVVTEVRHVRFQHLSNDTVTLSLDSNLANASAEI